MNDHIVRQTNADIQVTAVGAGVHPHRAVGSRNIAADAAEIHRVGECGTNHVLRRAARDQRVVLGVVLQVAVEVQPDIVVLVVGAVGDAAVVREKDERSHRRTGHTAVDGGRVRDHEQPIGRRRLDIDSNTIEVVPGQDVRCRGAVRVLGEYEVVDAMRNRVGYRHDLKTGDRRHWCNVATVGRINSDVLSHVGSRQSDRIHLDDQIGIAIGIEHVVTVIQPIARQEIAIDVERDGGATVPLQGRRRNRRLGNEGQIRNIGSHGRKVCHRVARTDTMDRYAGDEGRLLGVAAAIVTDNNRDVDRAPGRIGDFREIHHNNDKRLGSVHAAVCDDVAPIPIRFDVNCCPAIPRQRIQCAAGRSVTSQRQRINAAG